MSIPYMGGIFSHTALYEMYTGCVRGVHDVYRIISLQNPNLTPLATPIYGGTSFKTKS
jgi:hypothetical protein